MGSDDTGLSSMFLAQLAIGNPLPEVHYPYDPSDLGRCLRFLSILTEKEKEEVLRRAKHRSRHWELIVKNWDELIKLYNEEYPSGRCPKLYDFMDKKIGV